MKMTMKIELDLIPIAISPSEEKNYAVFNFRPNGTIRDIRTYEWTLAGWNTHRMSNGEIYTDAAFELKNDDLSTYYYAEV